MTSSSLNGNNRPTTHPFLQLALLIAAGLAGNYFKYPIFLNIDFLFGSIFAMLALQLFGTGIGILAAASIASYTWFIWNHPYAIIIMTAEVAVVGWLMNRRKMGMVIADTLFWLCIGMPLVLLFYNIIMHVPLPNSNIVMTKQAINGIANALIARLFFTVFTLRMRSALLSYSEIIYNLLAFFVLCPALILLGLSSRSEFIDTDNHIKTLMLHNSEIETARLQNWVTNRKQAIINLAELAASNSPQQMQPYLELIRGSASGFTRVGLLDRTATTTAYAPLLDEHGVSNVGVSAADRPYLSQLKNTLKPMFTEVLLGRIGTPKPRVFMLAPVVIRGDFGGYVVGVLNLEQIQKDLDSHLTEYDTLYTLLDKNGTIIITNRTDQKPMSTFVRGKGSLTQLESNISQWLAEVPPNTPVSERWKNSHYITETNINDMSGWKLILEQPVAPFQKRLNNSYTGKLFLLFFILLTALALAKLISRRVISTVAVLSMITKDLSVRLAQGANEISWPVSNIVETRSLISNFKQMAESLSKQIQEIHQVNESLEQRVEERTLELSHSRDEWQQTFNAIPDIITILDLHHNIQHANQAMRDAMNGGRDDSVLGFKCYKIVHGLDAPPEYCPHSKLLLDGLQHKEEIFEPLLNKYLLVTVTPIFDESGKLTGCIHVARDITERKLAEEFQKNLNKYHRTLIEASLDPLVTIDTEGMIADVNSATELVTGYLRHELIGTDFSNYFTEPEKARDGYRRVFKEGQVHDYPLEISHRDGRITSVLYNATVYLDSCGNVSGVFAAARDVTDLKRAEEERINLERQLLHTQKLESLGVLAGGIAHDFNNILTAIIGYAALAQIKLSPESPVAPFIQQIETAAERAADLSKQMLAYSGKGKFQIEALNLNRLLEDMLHMLKVSISKKVVLQLHLAPHLPAVEADATQIRQVVMNLVINASEAIGDSDGVITVNTGCITCDRSCLDDFMPNQNLSEGEYVSIEVTDTGCGMDMNTSERIFDPFFTTKFTGRGLGMSAVQGIVRGHRGGIKVHSEVGKGSTFQILLPVSGKSVECYAARVLESDWQGGGTVLLVDDEEIILNIGSEMLKELGFTVITAKDGVDALEIYKSGAEFSCVILDLTMPQMDGEQCFRELKKLDPEVKIIMSSGYSELEIAKRFVNLDVTGFIQKPYNFSQLKMVLKSAL